MLSDCRTVWVTPRWYQQILPASTKVVFGDCDCYVVHDSYCTVGIGCHILFHNGRRISRLSECPFLMRMTNVSPADGFYWFSSAFSCSLWGFCVPGVGRYQNEEALCLSGVLSVLYSKSLQSHVTSQNYFYQTEVLVYLCHAVATKEGEQLLRYVVRLQLFLSFVIIPLL